jgi:hypothetical protein
MAEAMTVEDGDDAAAAATQAAFGADLAGVRDAAKMRLEPLATPGPQQAEQSAGLGVRSRTPGRH